MTNVSETLGQRIVEAARMAVAIHLDERARRASRHARQQVVIGGAGPGLVTDDELSAATGRAERVSARPSQPFSRLNLDLQNAGDER